MFVYNLLMDTESTRSKVRKRKAALNVSFSVKKEKNTVYQKVSNILRKPLTERSNDEIELLDRSQDIVQEISLKKAQRQKIKERTQEYEDPANILAEKCKILADAVINSNHLIVYTGAGISTAACIPDYRGTNGIWTLLQQGKDIGSHDLSQAEPTLTHMALYCLYRRGILKHVVSQNCDGLHLRSGLPKKILSEVHGNMYLEVCSKCKPSYHYWRLFDVTEYTARYSHETLRLCYKCGNPLKDTIVHFGERGKLKWPLNWDMACKQADKADVILCLGSSLKVLKKYPWLWCMDKPVKKRPKLFIVNLQWTPKDDHSTLKINGKCDTVIEQMMAHLLIEIPKYDRLKDPIFHHATLLHDTELHTTSRSPIEKNPKTVGQVTVQPPKSENESIPSDIDDASMCSTPQNISLALNTEASDIDARADDLINKCDLDDDSKIKEENPSNTYSDKENVDSSMDNSMSTESISTVKVELPDVDHCDRQSNSSVISNSSSDYIVPEMSVETVNESVQTNTIVGTASDIKINSMNDHDENTETKPIIEVPVIRDNSGLIIQSMATDMLLLQTNPLQWYFGRSPWSDLSLFDIFTQRPILFAHSMLNIGGLAPSAFTTPNPSPLFDSYFSPVANVVSSNTVSVATKSEEVECLASSSTHESDKVVSPETVVGQQCTFCTENFASKNCLFYSIHPSNEPLDSNSVCLCCGGDEDDEEAEEPEEMSDKVVNSRVNSINPGWFGKGYRKKIKKRR